MAKIQPKRVLGVEEQEKALKSLYKEDSEKEKEKSTVRVTIDFSQAMHEQIKGEIAYNGQTIKGFVTTLIRDYFEKKGKA